MCAKQLNQLCNNEMDLCDPHRRLFCDFTATALEEWGLCKGKQTFLGFPKIITKDFKRFRRTLD